MTPLEAARKLAETAPDDQCIQGPYDCHFCGGVLYSDTPRLFPVTGHTDDCPWLVLPQIVAALEAAQKVVDQQFAAWCAHADAISNLADAMQSDKA